MKRFFCYFAFALASSSAICFPSASAISNDSPHSELPETSSLKQALKLFTASHYEESIEVCSSLLHKDPSNKDALLWIGENLIALHKESEAVGYFQQVLEQYPTEGTKAKAYYGLGRCHQALMQHEQAVADFSECLKVYTFSSVGYLSRASSLVALHEYNRAIEDLTMCISITKVNPSEYFVLRGDCYVALKQYENAVADYTAAIKGDPTNSKKWNWYFLRATAYRNAGEDISARSDILTANELLIKAKQGK